jgi:hypothetical protein
MKNRAQVSLEYMTMLGISLVIFAGVLYVATLLVSEQRTQIDVDTAYRAVRGIKELSDFIYVHGDPSKTRSTIHIPGNVQNLSIRDHVVRLRLGVGSSFTDVYAVTKANMTGIQAENRICPAGICGEGYYQMIFESVNETGGYDVNITVET